MVVLPGLSAARAMVGRGVVQVGGAGAWRRNWMGNMMMM